MAGSPSFFFYPMHLCGLCFRNITLIVQLTLTLKILIHYMEKKYGTLHEFACHPCAGAMLIFSVSFQFQYMYRRSEYNYGYNCITIYVVDCAIYTFAFPKGLQFILVNSKYFNSFEVLGVKPILMRLLLLKGNFCHFHISIFQCNSQAMTNKSTQRCVMQAR